MGKKIARVFITLVGLFVGPGIVALVFELLNGFNVIEGYGTLPQWAVLLIFIGAGIFSGIVFLLLSKSIINLIFKSVGAADKKIARLPANVVIPAVIGLIVGLIVAYFLSFLINNIFARLSWAGDIVNVIIYIVCAYLGISILIRHRPELLDHLMHRHKDTDKKPGESSARPKLLDTSVIIDGRIFDICNTGIIEGTLIIPEFVLDELRHIADSADDLKRNRGRRGLDVLKRIQTELDLPVQIVHAETNDATEVDSRLLTLAKEMNGIVVTNDYNLNKVAAVRNVSVFNINELANAVKPIVLPGEEMGVTIVKDGKEPGQGVAYLDDGTMIVVEGGRSEMNRTAKVIVTSVLQTAAGRMIFAKLK